MIYHQNYIQTLSNCKIKAWKNIQAWTAGFERTTSCSTTALLSQLGALWVRNIPVESEEPSQYMKVHIFELQRESHNMLLWLSCQMQLKDIFQKQASCHWFSIFWEISSKHWSVSVAAQISDLPSLSIADVKMQKTQRTASSSSRHEPHDYFERQRNHHEFLISNWAILGWLIPWKDVCQGNKFHI